MKLCTHARALLISLKPSAGHAAKEWVQGFMAWYNEEHRHSRIGFVTPGERHRGEDKALLAKRHEVYQAAKEANPARWHGQTRNWTQVGTVTLNPERPEQAQKLAAQKTGLGDNYLEKRRQKSP